MASTNTEAAAWASSGSCGPERLAPGCLLETPHEKTPWLLHPSRSFRPTLLEYLLTVLPFGVCSLGCYRLRRGETGGGKANSRSMLLATSTLFWAISKALFTSSKAYPSPMSFAIFASTFSSAASGPWGFLWWISGAVLRGRGLGGLAGACEPSVEIVKDNLWNSGIKTDTIEGNTVISLCWAKYFSFHFLYNYFYWLACCGVENVISF